MRPTKCAQRNAPDEMRPTRLRPINCPNAFLCYIVLLTSCRLLLPRISPDDVVNSHKPSQSRIFTSRQGTLHSRAPSQLLIQSTPMPVHSALVVAFGVIIRHISSTAALAKASPLSTNAVATSVAVESVVLWAPSACAIGFGNGDDKCRGSNQLLWMSKKQ